MTDKPEGITQSEWDLILEHRQQIRINNARNIGLQEAADLADSWGDQCAGGTGQGGEGYHNLANAIRNLMKSTGK